MPVHQLRSGGTGDVPEDVRRELAGKHLRADEICLLEALADCLFPPDDGPGAVDAGAVTYIEHALGGKYRGLLDVYHRGLSHVEERATARGRGTFITLSMKERQAVVEELMIEAANSNVPLGLSGAPSAAALESEPGSGFIALVWQHIREGLFCDPRHGGNLESSVWNWLGYSGPQLHGYTESELMENRTPSRPPRIAEDWMRGDIHP